MHPFWSNIYDDVKDRRYGTLFFATLLISLGLVSIIGALSVNLDAEAFKEFCLCLGPGLSLLIAALVWRWIRAARRNRGERLKHCNLSRDELAKARSKLKNQTKPVKFRALERPPRQGAPRARDTDLKY